jgi:hypothetical protein
MSEGGKSGKDFSWILNVAFALFAVVLAIVLAQAGLSFGQQLMVAVLLIVAGSQLSKLTSRSLPESHWPILAKGAGWVFFVAVMVNSSFVQKPLEWINSAEKRAAAGTLICSDEPVVVQTKETSSDGGIFALNNSCPVVLDLDLLRLQAKAAGLVEFQPHVVRTLDNPDAVMDQRESSLFRVSQITWVNGRPMMTVTPNPEGFNMTNGTESISLVAFLP